ncbi:MAG: DUF6599 family protein [Planctomycetota bacterium]
MSPSLDRFLRRVGLVRRARTAPPPAAVSTAVGAVLVLVPIALALAVYRSGTDPANVYPSAAGAPRPAKPPMLAVKGAPGTGDASLPKPPAASGLESLLPPKEALPAGVAAGEVSFYKPGGLSDRIDGREDIFILYGYEEAVVASYSVAGLPPGAALEVWIFKMKDTLRAFGIYSVDGDNPEAKDALLGERSAAVAPSVYFFRGPFFVKCQVAANLAGPPKDAAFSAANALAAAIDKAIGPREIAPMIGAFPPGANRGTTKFLPKDELDRDFLSDFFVAQYPEPRDGGTAPVELLFAPMKDAAAAEALLGRFRDYCKAAGKISRDEKGILEGEDAESLGFEARARGRFVLASSLFKDRAAARKLLDALAKSLEGK